MRRYHIEDRYALGDTNNEGNARVSGFHDGICGACGRNEYQAYVGARLPDCAFDGVIHTDTLDFCPALSWRHAGN